MIAIIILTGFALMTLIIGFFEIRIPFIHPKPVNKMQKTDMPNKNLIKESVKEAGSGVKNIKNFFRFGKNEVTYRIFHQRKTSDIA